ncbi:MAG: hypothetical protein HKM01_00600 [Gallionella sp.]|nr:hypothetical protein [Gallionella sp.]
MNTAHKKSLALGALLILLMAATRSHHFDSLTHLPDASLAVFLLAGFYLPPFAFPALLVVAGLADYFALNYAGISDWCFSPAYWFLIPTYAVLFYAGRFYATQHSRTWRGLGLFTLIACVATSAAFVISNITFYEFSGRYTGTDVVQYAGNIARYYLPYLTSALMYLVPAVLLHALLTHHDNARHPAVQ